MEWDCSKCGREIISKEVGKFCLECWWKGLVEKTEITPETIREFMEKYWFVSFAFQRGEYFDSINIEAKNAKTLASLQYYPAGLTTEYYPKTKRNKRVSWERIIYSDYSAFLEKLFSFAQAEKIKRIRGSWKTEKSSDDEILFKVDNIIIEKKTNKELEEE